MKLKMLLTAAVLALSPALAIAQCAGHEKQAMSCAEGSQFDEAKGACVVISS